MSDLFRDNTVDEIITAAENNVEWFFGDEDLQEIGSSDVSCCVAAVLRDLGQQPENVDQTEYRLIRNLVCNTISDVRARFETQYA